MSADRSAKAFPATWAGECSECGAEFDAEDLVGYVGGLLCCDDCWAASAPAEAPPIEDLLDMPEAAPAKPKRARKPAAKKLPAPRPSKRVEREETRPASELNGAGPIRRMEERQAAMEDPENDAAAMLFAAAGLLDEEPAQEVPAGYDVLEEDRPEPKMVEVQVGEGRNAFMVRVEEAPLLAVATPQLVELEDAVDMLEQREQPETVHRIEEPETSALQDTAAAFGDLVESPAQGAGKYDHLPLSAAQWAEQAAALQAAGTAPQTEYRINGQQVTPAEWLAYQQQLQDWHKHAEVGEQVNYVPATPDPLDDALEAVTAAARAEWEAELAKPIEAGAYYVCERQHITAQRPCEQCADVVRAEQQALLDAAHAAAVKQEQADERAAVAGAFDSALRQATLEPYPSPWEEEAAAADVANAQGWLGDDEPAGPHGLTFKELQQLSDTEDALAATPARYQGPLSKWQAEAQLDHLETILYDAIERHPRSQQKRIGPSELGTPCDHCLAAKLAEWDEVRAGGSWLPTIGTAVHTWIEQQLLEHMRRGLDAGRYLAEHKVVTGAIQGKLIPGSTDVFDVVAGMTVDWKIVGATTLRAARRGPSQVYRRQQHLYAKGWRDMGAQVDWVAIEYLPRNAQSLSERVRWLEEYDEAEACAALERAGDMQRMLDSVEAVGGVEQRDAFITMLPRDKDCYDCKRFPDYPRAPLDPTAGGLIDLGEVD